MHFMESITRVESESSEKTHPHIHLTNILKKKIAEGFVGQQDKTEEEVARPQAVHRVKFQNAPGASLMLIFKLFLIVRRPTPILPLVIMATNSP